MPASLFDSKDFRIPTGVVHVCAGGETPFLLRHDAALLRYATDKSDGMRGRESQAAEVERVRRLVADLWKVRCHEIGFVSNVAEGVSMVAESLQWSPGDNICVDSNEFPSVVAPFAMRQSPRIEIRVAKGAAPNRLAQQVNSRTRIVCTSYVSYINGERFDLASLREAADRVGAMLLVDYTQAAGYLPIQAAVADFAFSACYKWLLGTTGVAVAYWNKSRQPRWHASTGGWHSIISDVRPDYNGPLTQRPDAFQFTRGNPAHGAIYVLGSALDYLSQFNMQDVERYVQSMATCLHQRLREAQIVPSTPENPLRSGASVCVDSELAQELVDILARRGVYAWNGRGRVRFSFHGFNAMEDVNRIMEAIREDWPAGVRSVSAQP